MPSLLSYDISDKHEEFKKALLSAGYTDTLPGNHETCNLPNTTVNHDIKSSEEARNDCTGLAQDLSIALEKCIAVDYPSDHWSGIKGIEKTE